MSVPLLLLLFLGSPSGPAFHFHKGQKVAVFAFDMSSAQPRYWKPDLEILQRAAAEFSKEKRFTLVARPQQADFVFEIVYDPQSSDFAEAAVAVLPSVYGRGGMSLGQLRAEALWFGLSHLHRRWGPFGLGRRRASRRRETWSNGWGSDQREPEIHLFAHSSAKGLVKQFCKSVFSGG